MPNDKRDVTPTKEQKIAARELLKVMVRKRSGLPASFDDCMAFFTGYRETHIRPDSQAAFLDLAKRCADYCDRLHDKESLHLLMYAVIRRVNRSKPHFGIGYSFLGFLDMMVGDSTQLYDQVYDGDMATQVKDMSVLFISWLNFVKDKQTVFNSEPLIPSIKSEMSASLRGAAIQGKTLTVDADKTAASAAPSEQIPPLWRAGTDKDISFTRGGGLYVFLDMKKGLSAGFKNDNYGLSGIYVTPENMSDRDHFYAYDSWRCRAFLDKPSKQEATISPNCLYKTNHNAYEGFILGKDFGEIKELKLSFFPDTHYPLGVLIDSSDVRAIEPYLIRECADTLKRLMQMIRILFSSRKNRAKMRETIHEEETIETHQEELDSQLLKPVTFMKRHCENYLKTIPESKQASHPKCVLVNQLYRMLSNENSHPLIDVINSARDILSENKQPLESVQEPGKAFLRGVCLAGLKLVSFNQVYQDKPFLFFGSHGSVLVSELEKQLGIADEIIAQIVHAYEKKAIS
jgi:hypothetical protein